MPPSLGLVEKVWGGRLYLAVHEKKEGHTRWVRALSLQTHDPVEE
ncbi:MAG: hypothetical protein AB2766_12715 [Candidatus Thiodiazotropha endolucinida]